MRVVNFWNELSSEWVLGANVVTIEKSDLIAATKLGAICLGTVEYSNGSWLDIYNVCGTLCGVEWSE